MAEVSSGLSAYNWTDYDKKIKPQNLKEKLGQALSDNKLTGDEIKNLKKDFAAQGISEEDFYKSLSSVTGISSDKIKSADSSPVEFTFDINSKTNKVSAVIQDNNEDGDGDVTTTKQGGKEATVFSTDTVTPENIKFKDYKKNNFNEVSKTDKKSDFDIVKGGVTTIKPKTVADAISDDNSISPDKKIKDLQKSIGLTGKDIDGKFGPKTLSALVDKYNQARNSEDKAEVERLGKLIDKLMPSFEGTAIGKSLKEVRGTDKELSDKKEIIKKAGEFASKATEALKADNYDDFKKICADVKSSNLPQSVKDKVLDQLSKVAEKKLAENIGSPPAKELFGTDLIDQMPDSSPSKLTFKTLYKSEVKDGETKWVLKEPKDIIKSIKELDPKDASKVLSTLGPVTSALTLKQMDCKDARKIIEVMPPDKAAKALEIMDPKDAENILKADGSDKSISAKLLTFMNPEKAKAILDISKSLHPAWNLAVTEQMDKDKAKNIGDLDPKEAGNRLKSMDFKEARKIIDTIPQDKAVKILENMSPEAAGAILATDGGNQQSSAKLLLAMNPEKCKAILDSTDNTFTRWSKDVQEEMAKIKAQQEAKAEVKPTPTPDPKSEVKPNPKPVQKTEVKPTPDPKPDVKPVENEVYYDEERMVCEVNPPEQSSEPLVCEAP
ncbi:MAG: hypothetical protein U0354_17880 [Candidatus Sericytochromatia bacterium]